MSNFSVGNNVFDETMHMLGKVVSVNGDENTVLVVQGTGEYADFEGKEIVLRDNALVRARISVGDSVRVVSNPTRGDFLVGETGIVVDRNDANVSVDFLEPHSANGDTTHNCGILCHDTGWFFSPDKLEIVKTPRLKDIYFAGQTVILKKGAFGDYLEVIKNVDFGDSGIIATVICVDGEGADTRLGVELPKDIGFTGHNLHGLITTNTGWFIVANPMFVCPALGEIDDISDRFGDVIGKRVYKKGSLFLSSKYLGNIPTVKKVFKTKGGDIFYSTSTGVIRKDDTMVIPDYDGTETGTVTTLPNGKEESTSDCEFFSEYGVYFESEFAEHFGFDELAERHVLKDDIVTYVNPEERSVSTTIDTLISRGIAIVARSGKYYDKTLIVSVADKYGNKTERTKSEVDTTLMEFCDRHKCYFPKDLEMCPVCVSEYGSLDDYGHEQHSEYDDEAFYALDDEKSEDFGGLYYGVEIESEQGDRADSRDMKYFIAKLNTQFDDIFSCKYDGSLDGSGVESVTKPLSLRYHLETDLWDRFNACAKKHARISHDTTDCGFHVHFSRTPFEENNIDDYESEITLAYEKYYPEWKKISRRPMRSNHYCEYLTERGGIDTAKETWTKGKVKENMCRDRYLAVNTTNEYTIEIRIFRGTIVASTIRATLWLVNAVNQYILAGNSVEDCKSFKELIGYEKAPDYVKEYLYKRGL